MGVKPKLHWHVASTAILITAVVILACAARPQPTFGQTDVARPNDALSASGSIDVSADHCQRWRLPRGEVLLLRGHCEIRQDSTTITGERMVVWRRNSQQSQAVEVYAEGNARLTEPGNSLSNSSLFIGLETPSQVAFDFRGEFTKEAPDDALYRRGNSRRQVESREALDETQLVVPGDPSFAPSPQLLPGAGFIPAAAAGALRRVRVFPRSNLPYQIESRLSNDTTPPEQVWTITGGVNMLIDGVQIEQRSQNLNIGTIDLSADRMVVWTAPGGSDNLEGGALSLQSPDAPLQVYLEGNIIVRQGRNEQRATHAFFDVRSDRAMLLNAELKAYVPQTDGHVRLRADRIRQLSRDKFHAQNAWISTSPFGKPGYRLQASDIFVEPRRDFVGPGGAIDPLTGASIDQETLWVTSLNNKFLVGDFPLFYSSRLSFPAEEPNLPIKKVDVGQDRIFGFQVRTVWDMTKLFGIEIPDGVEWNLLADYLSERGPALGTSGNWQGGGQWGDPGSFRGNGEAWWIHDTGKDVLGRDRRSLNTDRDNRGRVRLQHRQHLPGNATLIGEVGYLSDRNLLEQFYENEFDESKDNETLLYLKQDANNWSWSALGRPQVNDFETTTEWLPKLDLYGLSEPLFGGLLTWSNHSSVGYAQSQVGDFPSDPQDIYVPLPYAANSNGLVAMTRQQVDAPFNLGPVKIVPYVMGEAAFWEEDFNGNSIERTAINAGVRSSLMFSRVFPDVRSRVFNLNGLAHKVTISGEYAWTDASQSLWADAARTVDLIPQYNEFDDNAQERFRSRLAINTFGLLGGVPAEFDPRYYAIRSGAGSGVTAPYHELIDDQQVARLTVRHRFQTKVGAPGNMRIKDWLTLEMGASFYPDADRDNFGEDVGLINGRMQWNVSDRTSVLAGTLYDLFDTSQELYHVGLLTQRSLRGSMYLGFRQVRGGTELDSRIMTASYSYQMSPKWVSTFGTAYDFGEQRNRGQSLTVTRVGLDWLVHMGASYDQSKGNVGVAFMVEPRFGQFNGMASYLGSLMGVR